MHDITNAVFDEMFVVSHRVVTAVKESLRTLPLPPPSNHQNTYIQQTIWSNKPSLNTIVTAKEVRVLPLMGVRTELTVPLNIILLHTSRMAILHNYGNQEWSDIVNKLNRASSRANLLQLTRGYSASTDIIDLMKERATSLYRNFFHVKFVEDFQISDDTTDVISNKLRNAVQFHYSTVPNSI